MPYSDKRYIKFFGALSNDSISLTGFSSNFIFKAVYFFSIYKYRKISDTHQKPISYSLSCINLSIIIAVVSFALFPSFPVQCRTGEFSKGEKNDSVKAITSSSGLLLTMFSLDWLSPDISGSENNTVLVLDLIKRVTQASHWWKEFQSKRGIFIAW